jgi:hypothetical protein
MRLRKGRRRRRRRKREEVVEEGMFDGEDDGCL